MPLNQFTLLLLLVGLILIVGGGVVLSVLKRKRSLSRNAPSSIGYHALPQTTRDRMDSEILAHIKTLQARFFQNAYHPAAPSSRVSAQQNQVRTEIRALGLRLYTDGGTERLRHILGLLDSSFQDVVLAEWKNFNL